jgi:hypothetical protein
MHDQSSPSSGRRSAIGLIVGSVAAAALGGYLLLKRGRVLPLGNPLADAADPSKQSWDTADYKRFISLLPDESLWSLYVCVGLASAEAARPASLDRDATTAAIEKQVVWLSSSVFTWPFKDNNVHYDELVRWVAGKYGVPSAVCSGASTFKVEQSITLQMFSGIWDTLDRAQRMEVLKKLDPASTLQNHAAIAAMSGTAAAGALAGAALLGGFGFYLAMSTFISSAAALLGMTAPWAVFQGASAVVGFLAANPVGWLLLGVAAIASVAWLGGANAEKAAAFVCQVNMLRAAAWHEDGRELP